MKNSFLRPSLLLSGLLIMCCSFGFGQSPLAPQEVKSDVKSKDYVQLNCTSDYLGTDESNRCKYSAFATRFKPEGKDWGLNGAVNVTIERTTPTTLPSSSTTGLPLWPGTASAETKNSSTGPTSVVTVVPPTSTVFSITGKTSDPK